MSQNEMQGVPVYGSAEMPPPAVVEEPAKFGPFARLMGILLSPGETFQDISRKPTVIFPMATGIILSILIGTLMYVRLQPDWQKFSRDQVMKQVERSSAPRPPEDQLQKQIDIGAKITPFFFAGAILLGAPISYLVIAGIFALGMLLLQANSTFKKILSAVSWTFCSVGVVSTLVMATVLMVKDTEALHDMNPTDIGKIAVTNAGMLLPSTASPVVRALASSLDVFTIWMLILLSIGLAAVAGSKRIKASSTGSLVFGLWFLLVLGRVGIAAVFGN